MGIDAEQRQLVSPTGCAFCAIVAGRAPAAVVGESALSLAFCDQRQPHDAEQGAHVLVIPRVHVPTLDRLDDAASADVMQLAVRMARLLVAEYGEEGYSLWQSNGEGAFQEVPHVHLHLLTRRSGDGLLRIYPDAVPTATARDALASLASRLRRHAALVGD
jgi:histidine triad (HIT) family protein